MEPQKLLKIQCDLSSGVYNKNEKKIASFRRWLLWIPLVIFASLLYIFDIGGEMRYHFPLPNNITASKYEGQETIIILPTVSCLCSMMCQSCNLVTFWYRIIKLNNFVFSENVL
jgi:hypothetical protein